MHPAYSVIFFTTASGAGYGLLALLGVFAAMGLLPNSSGFGFVAIAIAMGLIVSGLLSSTLHLGRPERALRAFSQWRTSWLSREGVAAIVSFVPAAILGVGWVFLARTDGPFAWAGALAAIMAGVTVFTTSMIYASLKPIRQWNQPLVPAVYLALGAMTGALLLAALTRVFQAHREIYDWLALVLIIAAWGLKIAYWSAIDTEKPRSDMGTATGLGEFGTVRMFEAPHTEENFLMQEMGFEIARKHARKLRRLVHIFLFALPLLLIVISVFSTSILATLSSLLAVASAAPGVFAERWLFFAEARHTCMLYYGREA